MTRRDLYGLATMLLGGATGLILAVPGVAFLLDPLGKRREGSRTYTLCRLGDLEVGQPRSFSIVDARQDAWVRYPREPVGLVWLVRQPAAGKAETVVAFTAECPHLGCAVKLAPGKAGFLCPCHNATFALDGLPENRVAPRGMDRLEVEPLVGPDPAVRVRFQRFRAQTREKVPLA